MTRILVSPAEFDRLPERQCFLESIAAGIADADEGRLIDTKAIRRRLAAAREKPRVSGGLRFRLPR